MNSKKVLINKNDTGFGLSEEAHETFLKKANIPFTKRTANFKTMFLKTSELKYVAAMANAKDGKDLEEIRKNYIHHCSEIPRDHPALWEVADLLGLNHMNDRFSKLEFVDVPEDRAWKIKEINGVEYIAIDPNPIPKFTGTCEHWYASDFRPPWMDAQKDTIVLVGIDKNGATTHMICGWANVLHDLVDLAEYKWYPLTKLCPIYHAK
jgi:hypothetical protein